MNPCDCNSITLNNNYVILNNNYVILDNSYVIQDNNYVILDNGTLKLPPSLYLMLLLLVCLYGKLLFIHYILLGL